jgi:hypothetical protein|tara:strand:+ start:4133 stop:4249 length:117 start_codon:yes stop_codon:yes gene_type:complete
LKKKQRKVVNCLNELRKEQRKEKQSANNIGEDKKGEIL